MSICVCMCVNTVYTLCVCMDVCMIYGDVCVNTHVYMAYAVYGMCTCARG